jgi:hypothetical protein
MVLAFSVSHGHGTVRIYRHQPVISEYYVLHVRLNDNLEGPRRETDSIQIHQNCLCQSRFKNLIVLSINCYLAQISRYYTFRIESDFRKRSTIRLSQQEMMPYLWRGNGGQSGLASSIVHIPPLSYRSIWERLKIERAYILWNSSSEEDGVYRHKLKAAFGGACNGLCWI